MQNGKIIIALLKPLRETIKAIFLEDVKLKSKHTLHTSTTKILEEARGGLKLRQLFQHGMYMLGGKTTEQQQNLFLLVGLTTIKTCHK